MQTLCILYYHHYILYKLYRILIIQQIDIDLKSLLVEAYHKGQQELLYVVPFVAKVLESCAKSRVFRPPNPWTMAIMNVLAELHQEPDLKLNLKFEIEVLCKNLTIDVGVRDVWFCNSIIRFDSIHKIEFCGFVFRN